MVLCCFYWHCFWLGVATGTIQLLKEHIVIVKTYSRCRDVKNPSTLPGAVSLSRLFIWYRLSSLPCTLSSLPHLCLPVSPLGMPSFIKSPDDQTGISGGVASFVCQAVGEPKPRITWMKKGKKVSSQRFEVQLRKPASKPSLSDVLERVAPPPSHTFTSH